MTDPSKKSARVGRIVVGALLLTLVGSVFIGLPTGFVLAMQFAERNAKEEKGIDWVCGGIELYAREHNGEWPRNWPDVWDSIQKLNEEIETGLPNSETEFQSLISIDYDVRVDELCDSPSERRIVWITSRGPNGPRHEREENLIQILCERASAEPAKFSPAESAIER